MGLTQQEINKLNKKIRHNSKSNIFDAESLSDKEFEYIRQKENKELYKLLAFIIAAALLLAVFS